MQSVATYPPGEGGGDYESNIQEGRTGGFNPQGPTTPGNPNPEGQAAPRSPILSDGPHRGILS
jgi:hypothetical protein